MIKLFKTNNTAATTHFSEFSFHYLHDISILELTPLMSACIRGYDNEHLVHPDDEYVIKSEDNVDDDNAEEPDIKGEVDIARHSSYRDNDIKDGLLDEKNQIIEVSPSRPRTGKQQLTEFQRLRNIRKESKWKEHFDEVQAADPNRGSSRFRIAVILMEQKQTDLDFYLRRKINNPLHWACYHGDKNLIEVML